MDFNTKFKRNKGITLIALVVTIIVLLILAGISIMMLTGQNGILNRASEAKNQTSESQSKEELELAISQLAIEYHLNGGADTFSDYIFSHEDDLKTALGSNDVSMDSTAKTITYKGVLYSVATDGTVARLDGIGLSESTKTLTVVGEEKGTFTLTATLTNISGAIEWTSSNTGVATVVGNGTTATVTAEGNGTTTIKAVCSGKEATCKVTVKKITLASGLQITGTTTIEQGATSELTVTQQGGGNEEIDWTSSSENVGVVKKDENTATITGKAVGSATITATAKSSGKKATCSVTVKEPSYIGQYLEYNIAYTDVFNSSKKYTAQNGWRILKMTAGENGTYDVDIISTGMPAGLQCFSDYITNSSYSPWTATADQITSYKKQYYASTSDTNPNMYAASGLRYNFKNIVFKQKNENTTISRNQYNTGYYEKISNNGIDQTGDNITGATFIASNIDSSKVEVRSVMHSDITGNEKSSSITVKDPTNATGLFILKNIGYTTNGYYWLASPSPDSSSGLYYVDYSGRAGGLSDDYNGLRPVVSISGVHVQKKAGSTDVWEITN